MITDLLWQRVKNTLFISKEQFLAALDGWAIDPIYVGGDLAFATLTKGPEFHFDSFGTKHSIPMRVIRARLQDIIGRYGYAMTRTPKDDAKQQRINKMFGCVVTGEDEYDLHYRIERLPCR